MHIFAMIFIRRCIQLRVSGDLCQNDKFNVIVNILSCGVLKFSSDFRVFGWSFLIKKIKTQILWF